MHGNTKVVEISNATAGAVQTLCAVDLHPGPLLDSFLEAGGISAVVRLLRKSTDPAVLVYTSTLIRRMMDFANPDGDSGLSRLELAELFSKAGERDWGDAAIH